MNKEDYFKYYIQGSDHYLIPKDVFDELFYEMVNWREEAKELKKQIEEYQKALDDTMSEKMDLEEENQKYKEVIDKAIEFSNKNWGTWCSNHLEYMTELQNILKEVD